MARQFSPKAFFREAPNQLLDRYFHQRGLLWEVDIASLGETDVDPIFRAWSDLPNLSRAQADEDFHVIDSVADEDGILAIIEEARLRGEDLEPTFANMGGFHDKAFWTFLEHPDYLETAARFREADERPKNYWRDRDGIPAVPPRDDPAGCEDLANVLKFYFRQKEAGDRLVSLTSSGGTPATTTSPIRKTAAEH